MKRGGNYQIRTTKGLVAQLIVAIVPLLFAYWAIQNSRETAKPVLFAVVWAVIAIVHLTYFTHISRKDLRKFMRNQAESTLQHDRTLAIINNLSDAIIATDQNGIVQLSNAAALSLLDTNTSINGKGVDSVISLTTEEGKKLKLSKLLDKATTVVFRDDTNMKFGDDTIHVSLTYTPIRGTDSLGNRAQKGFIIIMRDITRQKSLEEERDEFISVVSHELRTPITIAEGALSNIQLMNERGVAGKDQISSGITMAHEQILFLAGMINDLSTLSRAERGVMADKAAIEVEPFIHEIYKQYEAEAHKKGLHFNLDLDPQLGTVMASDLYLRELIQNFVTNAIKYTKQGSVTLIVHKKANELYFAVKDTGIGISKSDQKHVFEKFFRSEDYRTRETSGTGLGLYVAHKLSHLMGTTIELESRLNYGSTFSFTLPKQ